MILISTLIMVIFIYVAGSLVADHFGEIPRFREPLWILAMRPGRMGFCSFSARHD